MSLNSTTGWHELTSAPGVLSLDNWQHVAGTYDGDSIKLYVNGNEVAAIQGVFNIISKEPFTSNPAVWIGVGFTIYSYFIGGIDEVEIWSRAKTQAEIQSNMYTGLPPANNIGLRIYYKFDEGSGDNTADASDNGVTGILGCSWSSQDVGCAPLNRFASYQWSTGEITSSIHVNQTGNYTVNVTDFFGCSGTATQNVTINQLAGDPSVFGDNQWNVYAWNTGLNDIGNAWNTNYRGFLTATGLNFASYQHWGDYYSPSFAPGYQGCDVNVDNYSWSAKRKGFPCGFYQIDIPFYDEIGQLWVNGAKVWDACCGNISNISNVWTGYLDAESTVEFRIAEGAFSSFGSISFAPATAISISGANQFCDGSPLRLSVNQMNSVSYLWSTGATTSSINVTDGGTYSVTVTGSGTCSNTSIAAYKNIVKNPTPHPAITGDTLICSGGSTTLTASGSPNYLWTNPNIPVTADIYTDSVQGLRLALGLRKLVKTYNGPALQLSRQSDNATMDFGFVGNDLDTMAIHNWLNGETGYCTKLYDQSGNNGDVFVDNNIAVIGPAINLNGPKGKPVLHYNSAEGSMLSNTVSYQAPYTIIYGAQETGGSRQRVLTSVNNNWLLGYWSGGKQQAYFEGWLTNTPGQPPADDGFYIYSGTSDGTIANVYENSSQVLTSANGVAGPDGLALNGGGYYELSDADIYEVLIYDRVLSDDNRNYAEGLLDGYFISGNAAITVSPASTTTYYLKGYNSLGCADSTSVTVVVSSPASIGSVTGADDLCSGNKTAFVANDVVTGVGVGKWSSDDTNIATVDVQTGEVSAVAAGNCNIIYTITGACNGTVSAQKAFSVNTSSTNVFDVTTCVSYTWPLNGVTYTESGTYYFIQGCETNQLNLTINPITVITDNETACDSYTWPLNGVTYTESGTYNNTVGCYTDRLVLTITKSSVHTTTITSCGSYVWPVTGATYNSSGIYTGPTSNCITEQLDLTIAALPNSFTVNGGGSYCAGGTGVAVGLTGSQTGVSYQLLLNGNNNGSPTAGTGSAISFGNKTGVGTYTVQATNATTNCTKTMNGSVVVSTTTATTWYRDADGDGYGNAVITTTACTKPTGYVSNNTDCNDSKATVYPGAPEICDGLDNNCNGTVDEGCPALPLISIGNASRTEGNRGQSTMNFTITLSKASSKKITVNLATQNGTAIAGSDYAAKSSTITFKAGVTSVVVGVPIYGDRTVEPNEMFTVKLSNPVNAQIATTSATGTIINDDGAAFASAAETQIDIFLVPNPASSQANVVLKGLVGTVIIQLQTLEGKVIMRDKMNTATFKTAQQKIDVANIPNGVYIVTATDQQGNRQTAKLVVQH